MAGADYCTAFIEGWWAACCAAHDVGYAEQIGRFLADDRLLACVAHSVPEWAATNPGLAGAAALGSAVLARVMFAAVRLFGGRFYRAAKNPKKTS